MLGIAWKKTKLQTASTNAHLVLPQTAREGPVAWMAKCCVRQTSGSILGKQLPKSGSLL